MDSIVLGLIMYTVAVTVSNILWGITLYKLKEKLKRLQGRRATINDNRTGGCG